VPATSSPVEGCVIVILPSPGAKKRKAPLKLVATGHPPWPFVNVPAASTGTGPRLYGRW
jgi:hypothetical protein